MGTGFRIVAWIDDEQRAETAMRAAFARIAALDTALSDWKPDSELSRLSRAPRGGPVTVSDDLLAVLVRAAEIAQATGGAFDVTLGPFVVLWRRALRQRELPAPERLDAARASVGWRLVAIDREARTVTLRAPSMRLDLGGIGEGFAADAALAVLAEHGITRALVDAGGDLAIGDPPPDEDGWTIALRTSAEGPAEAIRVARCGVATSGDLFRSIEIDGTRWSHVIDPRTGLGVTARRSATVVAADAATADALATACCVLEPNAALEAVARIDGAAALVRQTDDEATVVRVSPGFPARVDPNRR